MASKKPLTVVVFGATGDLYQNKLAPAFFSLFASDFLPDDFQLIGFARRPIGDQGLAQLTREAILKHKKEASPEKVENFLTHIRYVQGDLDNLESFQMLSRYLGEGDLERGACSSKLFYLAVPPNFYAGIFENIYKAGLALPCASGVEADEHAWTRLLVEKPFGTDRVEAEKLDHMLGELFAESQIFRIDHYLAKEAVQNILNFRFENGIFEPMWNSEKIEKIRVVFHEQNDLAKRGDFYDALGALRDVGQNHMLQLLALIAMDNPAKLNAEEIHQAREAVLEHTKFKEALVRGQYEGYRSEMGVNPNSDTETFFRVNVEVDTPRWRGVDFELESGKALAKSDVYIDVYFKNVDSRLTFSVSSNRGSTRDAYEKVLEDCIVGDETVFVGTKEIMAEWRVVSDIIAGWKSLPLVIYKKGSRAKEIK